MPTQIAVSSLCHMMVRIMIADDYTETRMLLRDLIGIANHEVIAEATDGLEAEQKFKTTRLDLVLLDLTMPKMDGLSVLKGNKENR
jgi:two-component system, chemotaxis family, chemotaxis protein CheY